MAGKDVSNQGLGTISVHAGTIFDDVAGGVNTPILPSSSFRFPNPAGEVAYPRYGNIPTQKAPAEKIAALEGAEAGLVMASGLAAISMSIIACVGQGDHVVFQDALYGGTHHFISAELTRLGVEFTFVGSDKLADYEAAFKPNTKVVYLESPTNPLLSVVDLAGVAALAKERGAVSIIDNTFATPINQRPLELGFDIVTHSGTKYLNGHSDLNCGAVAASKELIARVREASVNWGVTLNVYDCFLLERGMKTLALRMERHNQNGQVLAEFLDSHSRISKVYYPGLPGHPGHEIAKSQMKGFGGMLSFELDCDLPAAERFMGALKLIIPAVSLGGVESLICFPAQTSHAKISAEERRAVGISDTLLRLSVGIEDAGDLMADLKQAMAAI